MEHVIPFLLETTLLHPHAEFPKSSLKLTVDYSVSVRHDLLKTQQKESLTAD